MCTLSKALYNFEGQNNIETFQIMFWERNVCKRRCKYGKQKYRPSGVTKYDFKITSHWKITFCISCISPDHKQASQKTMEIQIQQYRYSIQLYFEYRLVTYL